jgi:hypothetical protein
MSAHLHLAGCSRRAQDVTPPSNRAVAVSNSCALTTPAARSSYGRFGTRYRTASGLSVRDPHFDVGPDSRWSPAVAATIIARSVSPVQWTPRTRWNCPGRGRSGARGRACHARCDRIATALRPHCDRKAMIRTCSAAPLGAKPLVRRGAASGNRTRTCSLRGRTTPTTASTCDNSCSSHTFGCNSGTVRPEFAPRLIPRRARAVAPSPR